MGAGTSVDGRLHGSLDEWLAKASAEWQCGRVADEANRCCDSVLESAQLGYYCLGDHEGGRLQHESGRLQAAKPVFQQPAVVIAARAQPRVSGLHSAPVGFDSFRVQRGKKQAQQFQLRPHVRQTTGSESQNTSRQAPVECHKVEVTAGQLAESAGTITRGRDAYPSPVSSVQPARRVITSPIVELAPTLQSTASKSPQTQDSTRSLAQTSSPSPSPAGLRTPGPVSPSVSPQYDRLNAETQGTSVTPMATPMLWNGQVCAATPLRTRGLAWTPDSAADLAKLRKSNVGAEPPTCSTAGSSELPTPTFSLTAPDKENLRQNLLPRTPSPRLLEGPFSPRRARDVKLLR